MMITPELILAVDCGSTNLKAAVFDSTLTRLGTASVPVTYSAHDGTLFEMPVGSTVDAFRALCTAVCRDAGVASGELAAVAFGSQAQTFAVVDCDGVPTTPFISWMDKRAVAEAEELQDAFGSVTHRHCSFPRHIPQLQLAKLLWLQRHTERGIEAKDRIVPLPTYLGMALGCDHITDRNIAAMGGAYSLQTGRWWREALGRCGIPEQAMGDVVNVGESVPCRTGPQYPDLPAVSRVVLAGNDQTAGAYGNGCREGDVVVTLGTALVVYRFAGRTAGPFSSTGCWGPFPGGAYYELATRDEGCMALDRAMETIMGKRLPRDFDALAATAWEGGVAADDVLFYPEKVHTSHAWSTNADPMHMAYAVLEGITFALKDLVERELNAGADAERIVVTGGGSNSGIWLKIIATALDTPVRVGKGDALLGAAALAAGKAPVTDTMQGECIQPDRRTHDQLEKRYEAWHRFRTG